MAALISRRLLRSFGSLHSLGRRYFDSPNGGCASFYRSRDIYSSLSGERLFSAEHSGLLLARSMVQRFSTSILTPGPNEGAFPSDLLSRKPLATSERTIGLCQDLLIPVTNFHNEDKGFMVLAGDVFDLPIRKDIIHRVVRWQLAKRQQGTHSTKTISDVSGTGKKPWKQKGFGRARHGTLRGPQFRGGATLFGPKPRSHAFKLNKKVRRLGLKIALSARASEGKVAMPNLESMKLSTINMQKLWDDKLLAHSCIQNLTSLIIDNCGSLKYVFSSLVAMELVKMHYLEITNCQMLEEIFVLEGKLDPSTQKPLSSEEVIFPNLETLVTSQMDNLKSVWHNQLATNSFCKLKKMETSFCNKLLIVYPSYVLNKLHNLETMLITNCPALEVIFEIQDLSTEASSKEGLGMQLRTLTLIHLPMLKHIWSRNTYGWLRFQKLRTLKAIEFESLNHIGLMELDL